MTTPRRSKPDPKIEALVTDMLTRRATDIPDDPQADSRPLPEPTVHRARTPGLRAGDARRGGSGWPRQLAIAAAILVLGGGVVATVDRFRDTDRATGPTARVETATESQEPDVDPAEVPDPATEQPPPGPTLDEAMASLPDDVDVRGGSMLWLGGPPTTEPAAAAAAYLADRLPDLTIELQPVDDDGTLHLFQWSVGGDAMDLDGVIGWVMVRLDPDRAGVVAAMTDGIVWGPLARADGRLTVSVDDQLDGELYADVTDLYGVPVPDAPASAGQDQADVRAFGTAGSTDGADRLEVEVTVPPWPVAVRVQHVGGTWITIAEFTVEPAGFAASCGSEPPVTIDVGARLGPLEPGPSGRSSIEPTGGQGVWHHPATDDSLQTAIEIRWPADPVLVGRFQLGSFEPDATAVVPVGPSASSSESFNRVTGEQHGIVALGQGAEEDPCDLVQLSVLGDPPTAHWWAGALTAQWSFGFPLTVAGPDLDPRLNPDAQGSSDAEGGADPDATVEDGGLVVTVIDTDPAAVPQVPATGSCDGLPDDPPRVGTGSDEGLPTAREALATFVAAARADPTIDPPLPTAGYTEYVGSGADGPTQYVIGPSESAIVVIEVERIDGTWQVTRWEAAPC